MSFFNKHLLNIPYVPGPVLDPGNTSGVKHSPVSWNLWTDGNQIISLCKLGSLLRVFELGQVYIPVAFRNPMGAQGAYWPQDLIKSPSSSSRASSQEVGGTSAPVLQREQLPKW